MQSQAARPQRHDLLLVAAADWPLVAATRRQRPPLEPEPAAIVERWGHSGFPVGLPLPPALGKARMVMSVPDGVPWRVMPAVTLAQARDAAPVAWRATIDSLLALGRSVGSPPHVFGALLWQSVTGLPYVHAASDIDLIWTVPDAVALGALLDSLARIQPAAPMRIDGEVITNRGGIAWRELAAARHGEGDVVLAKSIDRARFVSTSTIFEQDFASCC
jgi:phosphoribosyl-dephospho-CoA transferase